MILDSLMQLSNSQAVTADAYTTNTIDLGNVTPKRSVGTGEPLVMVVNVEVAADFTTGDETYAFEFVQSANADLSSHTALVTRTIAASLLTAGSIHPIPVPAEAITARYIGGRFDVGGTSPTITCSVYLQPASMAAQKPATYASGYTIS